MKQQLNKWWQLTKEILFVAIVVVNIVAVPTSFVMNFFFSFHLHNGSMRLNLIEAWQRYYLRHEREKSLSWKSLNYFFVVVISSICFFFVFSIHWYNKITGAVSICVVCRLLHLVSNNMVATKQQFIDFKYWKLILFLFIFGFVFDSPLVTMIQ